MQEATESLTGNRFSGPEIVEAPKIRSVDNVRTGAMDHLEIHRVRCTRRNPLGVAGVQTVVGGVVANVGLVAVSSGF